MKKSLKYILFIIVLVLFSIKSVKADTCSYGDNNLKFICSNDSGKVVCTVEGPSSRTINLKDTSNINVGDIDSCSNGVVMLLEQIVGGNNNDPLSAYLYSSTANIPNKIGNNNALRKELPALGKTDASETENIIKKLSNFNGKSCVYSFGKLRYACTIKNGKPDCKLGCSEGSPCRDDFLWDDSTLIHNFIPSDFLNGDSFVCPYDSSDSISLCGVKGTSTITSVGKVCPQDNILKLSYQPNGKDFEGNQGHNNATGSSGNPTVIPGLSSNIDIDFDTTKGCESYLGNPDDNVGKPPAYYLQFVFDLMKYIAILLLLALTVADFAKAITSGNQDAIKKAALSTLKRLIIAVVIFLLPMLIEFLFRILGIYSSSTCGIK